MIQKHNAEDHLRIDELEQYDRRQKLELQGVPMTENEYVMQITLELIKKLDEDIEEQDISIARHLSRNRYLHCRQRGRMGKGVVFTTTLIAGS